MLERLLGALGIGASATTHAPQPGYAPYAEPHANRLYDLLFCDDLALYETAAGDDAQGLWRTLLAESADVPALRAIAEDDTTEGRARALAFGRLRDAGEPVPSKIVLGAIVEVAFDDGLDVIAAFSDGGVRYLNKSGKVLVFEGSGHPVATRARKLVAATQPVVDRIGPWKERRRPPPSVGNVRMTFLVSDGLYFGEGPFEALARDAMGGPVIARAAELVKRAVAAGTK